ncbi:hypothetical protein Pcinc_036662 [Petrolisthes cinctipes]|uniref:Uncharacterized protein n=1 Tax=Petrolisthes cinctipes TaxID=88211 RepID=A0AAE1BU19_PETCI|nr:hypothetical protein Pcinc_036662 [Petrolisthes cinctipes]
MQDTAQQQVISHIDVTFRNSFVILLDPNPLIPQSSIHSPLTSPSLHLLPSSTSASCLPVIRKRYINTGHPQVEGGFVYDAEPPPPPARTKNIQAPCFLICRRGGGVSGLGEGERSEGGDAMAVGEEMRLLGGNMMTGCEEGKQELWGRR